MGRLYPDWIVRIVRVRQKGKTIAFEIYLPLKTNEGPAVFFSLLVTVLRLVNCVFRKRVTNNVNVIISI